MKLIITESQYKVLKESSKSKLTDEDKEYIKQFSLWNFVNKIGLNTNQLNKIGISLDSKLFEELSGMNHEEGIELLNSYMENKFDEIYDFESNPSFCKTFESSEIFYDFVDETISEFLYNNYYVDIVDEDTHIMEDLAWVIGDYLDRKYGERIRNKFKENCY